jgi:hypothetical protein
MLLACTLQVVRVFVVGVRDDRLAPRFAELAERLFDVAERDVVFARLLQPVDHELKQVFGTDDGRVRNVAHFAAFGGFIVAAFGVFFAAPAETPAPPRAATIALKEGVHFEAIPGYSTRD